MAGADGSVLVLTYHSIADASGPTSIAPDTFVMQLDALAECGLGTMASDEFIAWRCGGALDPARRVLITFDDGYADFATAAMPELHKRGQSAIVFVPTGRLGGIEQWMGASMPPRRLLDRSAVRELGSNGVEFGSHGVTHSDLTRLTPGERLREIRQSAEDLAALTGRPTRCFAAPYGHVNREVQGEVSKHYEAAFGTRFDRARPNCDRFNVPRIEMHYFRDPRRWRAFVAGDDGYFLARRALRAGRTAAMRLFGMGAESA